MNKIHIKLVTEEALAYIKKNLSFFTQKVQDKSDNSWIKDTIPGNIFIEKIYKIDNFSLQLNPKSANREIDYHNGIILYEKLKHLPRYILTNVRFWLWLILDKFYIEAKSFMEIKNLNTLKSHWLDYEGRRRSLFFGVLSRLYFRVERTVNNGNYELTQWIFEYPERFRNLSWRIYSNNKNVVIGCIKGCKKAVEATNKEDVNFYIEIAKYISFLGSANLLDAYSIDDLSMIVYNKYIKLVREYDEKRQEV